MKMKCNTAHYNRNVPRVKILADALVIVQDATRDQAFISPIGKSSKLAPALVKEDSQDTRKEVSESGGTKWDKGYYNQIFCLQNT